MTKTNKEFWITGKFELGGKEILTAYSFSDTVNSTFMCAHYMQTKNGIYPTVTASVLAVALGTICPGIIEFFMGHEIGHIMNGDISMEDCGSHNIMDYDKRIRGEIPEKEFKADRFSWDYWIDEDVKQNLGKEFAYLNLLIPMWENRDEVENEFKTRAQVLGVEIATLTEEEQEEFKKRYKKELMSIIENNIKTGRYNPDL